MADMTPQELTDDANTVFPTRAEFQTFLQIAHGQIQIAALQSAILGLQTTAQADAQASADAIAAKQAQIAALQAQLAGGH